MFINTAPAVMRKQIRLKIASICLTLCEEMGEFQKSLTAYKLYGVTRAIGIILNKQCVGPFTAGTTDRVVRVSMMTCGNIVRCYISTIKIR